MRKSRLNHVGTNFRAIKTDCTLQLQIEAKLMKVLTVGADGHGS